MYIICLILINTVYAIEKDVLKTEVFKISINNVMFNWTSEENNDYFVYQPSLYDAPDLPSWINYIYSRRQHTGFLYGVPPEEKHGKVPLEIIALNMKNYETRYERLDINIKSKKNSARYEVHMKIDNVNVEDMLDDNRMDRLKDVYRRHLWSESKNDLYPTFLASAVELGARKPPNPKEGEGVVIRLGSIASFSLDLKELQEEVRPLWKVPSCPRDFKRTSVERYFRNAGFALDWCSFRLVYSNISDSNQVGTNEKLLNSIDNIVENRWKSIKKSDIPIRSYVHETVFTVVMPVVIMFLLIAVLTLILCLQHEGIQDESSEEFFDNIFHICYDYIRSKRLNMETPNNLDRTTNSLRSLSNNRELSLSPDTVLLSTSPTSTISRGVHCRPSPPPYVRPKYKSDL